MYSTMNNEFDIIIVGASLVGASLALALASSGKRIALVDRSSPLGVTTAPWDTRLYAINPVNRAFLEQLTAWPDMSRIGTIETIEVHGDRKGYITFSHRDVGVTALAWVAESRWMMATLWQRLVDSDTITLFTNGKPSQLLTTATQVTLTLDEGQTLTSRVLVAADGADSWVRRMTGLPSHTKSYLQSGVVANFRCERPHANTARQWFLGDSVLAWLPMAGQNISMVWSTPEPERVLALSDDALATTVAGYGGHSLGAFSLLTPAAAFPLRQIRVPTPHAERVVLVGDAAHTIHPLAGQGVNLGLQDAATLARLMARSDDPGSRMLLRRYERERREAVMVMHRVCDGLHRLFHEQQLPAVAWLRNTGLSLVNQLLPIKRQWVRCAVGL